jgi:hypothetical protein
LIEEKGPPLIHITLLALFRCRPLGGEILPHERQQVFQNARAWRITFSAGLKLTSSPEQKITSFLGPRMTSCLGLEMTFSEPQRMRGQVQAI